MGNGYRDELNGGIYLNIKMENGRAREKEKKMRENWEKFMNFL